uniref:Galectin n=1 Tax=Pogona vitticeps TaxID=103695 RepID=A0A6J0VC52_9SAUR
MLRRPKNQKAFPTLKSSEAKISNSYPGRLKMCSNMGDRSTKDITQLCPGQTITVCGTISPCADRFRIDLLSCSGDIVFHFNPRFNPCQSPCIVCNTETCGCWGCEEVTSCVPFQPGCYVVITIKVEQTRYEVSACGQHILNYCHRLPPCTVRRVSVSGDFAVCGIQICG